VNRQREDPVGDYLQTLDRLEALDPTIALCGHGDPLRDPRRRISELRSETRSETERVEAALGSDPLTVWQITERRYAGRDLPVGPRMLALRETLAHLEHLRTRGAVNRETWSGGDRFSRG
jgi:glyoxylase-like metal-dependent hydrolase (beta-lactamase superfamily II)